MPDLSDQLETTTQGASQYTNAPGALTPPPEPIAPPRRIDSPAKRSSGTWLIASFAMAAAVVGLSVYASIRQQREAALAHRESPAIVVLPFENIGRRDGQDVADGMTEEITDRLSSLRGLRVIGSRSASTYARTTSTPQQIASDLKVKYLLTGTVRWDSTSGGSVLVRVSPSLVKADDGTQVWSEVYQTAVPGMFDVQSKIAGEVADALNLNLLAPEREALATKPTDNLKTYTLYLRAKHIVDEKPQAGALRTAVGMLQQATAANPKFLSAWAYLSIANTELYRHSSDHAQSRLQAARDALAKAAALDPDSPDAHLARGIYLVHGQLDDGPALTEFNEAGRLRPNDPHVPLYQGEILRRQGEWLKSAESFRRAIDLEPRSGTNMIELGATLILLRQYKEAEQYIDRGMILAPENPTGPRMKAAIAIDARGNVFEAIEHLRNGVLTVTPPSAVMDMVEQALWPAVEDPMLRGLLLDAKPSGDVDPGQLYGAKAFAHWYLRDLPRARAHADTAVRFIQAEIDKSPEPSNLYECLALAEATRGRRTEALTALAEAEELVPYSEDQFSGAARANLKPAIFAMTGDTGNAIAELQRRVNAPGGLSKNAVRLDARYASLRADPRFQRLIQNP